tara:strand:+ start:646 stop:840 length:195 start_codon:yes stop_codon:yes gene_type:complete
MDGVAFDRIVGFEDLGAKDDFPTLLLTRKLVKTGCLRALTKDEKGEMRINGKNRMDDSDNDEDY